MAIIYAEDKRKKIMAVITLKIKLPKELRQAAETFPKAGSAVLNRTVRECRTLISREVPKEWNVKASDVREKIRLENATKNKLSAKIIITSKNFPVIQFVKNPKPTVRQEPVIVEVKRGKKTQLTTRTFIQNVKGQLGVFQRVGKQREPFKYRQYIKATLLFNSRSLREKLNEFVSERIKKELPRLINVFQK